MSPGGCLCRFDYVPQDGDSEGVAEAHPAPNAGLCHPTSSPMFVGSNPAMEEEENDLGWSTSETSGSQYNT